MGKETYLTFIENAGSIKYKKSTVLLFKCKCVCGNLTIVRKQHFLNKHTVSCGCHQKEITRKRSLTHGMTNTKTYRCYYGMINRCYNKKIKQYKDYGGRGIIVSDQWRESFENFYKEMGECPSQNHSIDRIDTNGNYEFLNCKWSNGIEQCSNKRNNVKYLYNGELLTITEISRRSGIVRTRISNWKNRSKYSKEKIELLIKKHETSRVYITEGGL